MRRRGAAAMCWATPQKIERDRTIISIRSLYGEKLGRRARGSVEIALNVKFFIVGVGCDKNNKLERNFMFLWRCVLALCWDASVKWEYCVINLFFGLRKRLCVFWCFGTFFVELNSNLPLSISDAIWIWMFQDILNFPYRVPNIEFKI